jgi:hypothetical protein
MALAGTGSALGDKISSLIISSDAPADAKANIQKLWRDIGAVIVNHMIENIEIKPGIPVTTAGSPTAQTGATTGPGKTV